MKIDRGFTAAIGTDAVNATVTDTIITLAQRLKLKLVAEGVETEEQAEYLRSQGVNALQGYYFAKPMPINVFPLWLQQYETRQRVLHQQPQKRKARELVPSPTPLPQGEGTDRVSLKIQYSA